MAVTSVDILYDTADETVTETKYTATYLVQTDSRTDRAGTVLADPRLPVIGSPYVSNTFATCKRRNPTLVRAEESLRVWNVVCEFSTNQEDEDPEEKEKPPLLRLAKWSGSFQQFQSIAEKDRDDKPILNTAGDAFDPPLMKDDSRPIITCQKNFSSLSLNFWASYRDAINQSTWGVFGPKTVKVMQISWQEMFEGDSTVPYYQMTFSFQVNPDTWDDQVLNRGFRQIENAGEEPKPITVASNVGEVAVSEPALLDENGKLIPKADLPAAAHFVTAKKYQVKNFASLGIPTPGVRS